MISTLAARFVELRFPLIVLNNFHCQSLLLKCVYWFAQQINQRYNNFHDQLEDKNHYFHGKISFAKLIENSWLTHHYQVNQIFPLNYCNNNNNNNNKSVSINILTTGHCCCLNRQITRRKGSNERSLFSRRRNRKRDKLLKQVSCNNIIKNLIVNYYYLDSHYYHYYVINLVCVKCYQGCHINWKVKDANESV